MTGATRLPAAPSGACPPEGAALFFSEMAGKRDILITDTAMRR